MKSPALSRLAAFTLAGAVCASTASAQSSTGSSAKPPPPATQAPSVPPNVDRIREIQPWFQGDWVLILADGTRLHSGKSYRSKVREYIERLT